MNTKITSSFSHLILLLFQFGFCFILSNNSTTKNPSKRKKINKKKREKEEIHDHPKKQKLSINPWPYLIKRVMFLFKRRSSGGDVQSSNMTDDDDPKNICTLGEAIKTQHPSFSPPKKRITHTTTTASQLQQEDVIVSNSKTEPIINLRTRIYACKTCGEVFHNTHLLESHQSIRHAISELSDSTDSGRNVVQIIFQSNWMSRRTKPAQIIRILKVHNSPKILNRFEDYRELMKAKAITVKGSSRSRHERCLVDGNELLRFYCSTFSCTLGYRGNSSLCNQVFCSLCRIIKSGFCSKLEGGVCTYASSDRAHHSLPEDLEAEFSFMNIRRAILVCRVIAGRIAYGKGDDVKESYDSAAGHQGGDNFYECKEGRYDLPELHVFNPRAVLPCFVIVYKM